MSKFVRGDCSQCGRRGAVRADGTMWAHRCMGARFAHRVRAQNIQTYSRRVEQFVDAILPADASPFQRAEAIRGVYAQFGWPKAGPVRTP